MATIGIREDLGVLNFAQGSWWYKEFRIQADPNVHRFTVRYLSERHKGTVLDLGSGNGALPAQLLDAGFRVASTTWNGQCRVGDTIYEINLDNGFRLDQVGGKYDVITAIDIIEHVENPWAFMRSCRQALNDDGTLIVSTPNLESARARIEWLLNGETSDFTGEQVRNNRHISLIGRSTFSAMAEQAAFQIISQYAFGRYIRNSFVKRNLFLLLERFLPQCASGTTTLYVLKPSGRKLSLGPEKIY